MQDTIPTFQILLWHPTWKSLFFRVCWPCKNLNSLSEWIHNLSIHLGRPFRNSKLLIKFSRMCIIIQVFEGIPLLSLSLDRTLNITWIQSLRQFWTKFSRTKITGRSDAYNIHKLPVGYGNIYILYFEMQRDI